MQSSDDLKLAIEAVKKAGEIIKNGFGQALEITIKESNKSIVTQIDQASEKAVINTLQAESGYPILAEESGKTGEVKDTFWVIDPLDGTRNFSRGIPIFCVSIALIKNGSIALGVTLNPITGDIYFAVKGEGSYLNKRSLKVSNRSVGQVLILNKGYGQREDSKFIKVVEKLSPVSILRRLGSSALELCFVAQGSVEGFISFGDELWDYAAGVLLVSEAGGKVTDWKGQDWDIDGKYVLASNGLIHDKIKGFIENLQTI